MLERALWCIRAGRAGEADALFKSKSVIALGWHGTQDLAPLPNDREAFKAAYRAAFPEASEGNVNASASQLYRFVHELQEGDVVAYPSKLDRQVHLGRVNGPYAFVSKAAVGYCHQRSVT